mmetsp:Transcript_21749/g.70969  ORF Transcript_21749/g.70969 Transcript_21749/m.70969 type:complete len:132 (-) Transcript_21749:561-956(-)
MAFRVGVKPPLPAPPAGASPLAGASLPFGATAGVRRVSPYRIFAAQGFCYGPAFAQLEEVQVAPRAAHAPAAAAGDAAAAAAAASRRRRLLCAPSGRRCSAKAATAARVLSIGAPVSMTQWARLRFSASGS